MNIQELAKIKYVFFDIDGVLSVPKYRSSDTCEFVSGFTDEEWLKFDIISEHPYKDCIAPQFMKEFVSILANNRGISKRVFCLTADNNSFAYRSKIKFIAENYPEIASTDVIMVSSKELKVDVIKYIAEKHNIKLKDCCLVEDTFQTIIDAELADVSNLHVAGVPDLLEEIRNYRIDTRIRNYELIYEGNWLF